MNNNFKIIAETAFSHEGSFDYLEKQIKLSKEANADYIKFQILLNNDAYITSNHTNYNLLNSWTLSEQEWQNAFDLHHHLI